MTARIDQVTNGPPVVTDEYGIPVPGASIYVYNPNGTAASLTSDGTTALAQPILTNEFGVYSYFAANGIYREDIWFSGKLRKQSVIAIGPDTNDLIALQEQLLASLTGANFTNVTVNVSTRAGLAALDHTAGIPAYLTESGYEGIFVYSTANHTTDVTDDPGQNNFVAPASSPTGVAGAWVRTLDATFRSQNLGVQPAGGVTPFHIDKETNVTPNPDGLTDWRGFVHTVEVDGSNPASQIMANQHRVNAWHSAPGNITFLYGYQGFIRVNNNGTLNGTVTSARGFEHHIALENAGSIQSAYDFYAQSADLSQSTGAGIGTMVGFQSGDQGHATAVTGMAVGFNCANMTAGAPVTAGFRSEMASGTGRWAFLCAGSAPSAFGACRIGQATPPSAPTDTLETLGFAKLSQDGTKNITGTYHEIRSAQVAQFAVQIGHTHVSQPNGIDIFFSGGTINDTTRRYLQCRDASATRLQIFSNGSIASTAAITTTGGGIGYATGAGGTVTQATSKSTPVTLNTLSGQITTAADALGASGVATIPLNNSQIAATDQVIVTFSAPTVGAYTICDVVPATGSCAITIRNVSAVSHSEAIIIKFTVIKAVNS